MAPAVTHLLLAASHPLPRWPAPGPQVASTQQGQEPIGSPSPTRPVGLLQGHPVPLSQPLPLSWALVGRWLAYWEICRRDSQAHDHCFRTKEEGGSLQVKSSGASTVVQRVNGLPVMPTSHVSSGSSPGCSTPIQRPADVPGKAVENGPASCLGSCHSCG